MTANQNPDDATVSEKTTRQIDALADWRGETLARIRALILQAAPNIHEEWKWQKATSPGTPVWKKDGASARANRTEVW